MIKTIKLNMIKTIKLNMTSYPQTKKLGITVIAHRGYSSKYPGNTLLAFEKAIEAGADYIEFDVRRTKDEKLVVFHDNTTKSISNKNKHIEMCTLEELQAIKLPMEQHICSLKEMITLCKGKIGLQMELKGVGVAEPAMKMVNDMGMKDHVLYSAFNEIEIWKLKELDPECYCAPLISSGRYSSLSMEENFKWMLYKTQKLNARAMHPSMNVMDDNLMPLAKAANITINVWTVDGIPMWEALMDMGVDGIITNDPKGLVDYLKSL